MDRTDGAAAKQKKDWKHWAFFCLRWGIAVAGVWYVIHKMTLEDQAYAILDPHRNYPQKVQLPAGGSEDAVAFNVAVPETGKKCLVARALVVNQPDPASAELILPDGQLKKVQVVGLDLPDLNANVKPTRLLIVDDPKNPDTDVARWIPPELVKNYQLHVPYPRVQIGIIHMVSNAKPSLLVMSVLIFSITFLLTSYRWHELLKALEIHIGGWRVFELNMVGCFYNTFIPGSTGGDALKALYASKQTPHRMRAVMSVLVDRVIGLIALIIVGGVAASFRLDIHACQKVAAGSGAMILCVIIGLLLFYNPTLHRVSGLDFFLKKLPMQRQVKSAVDAMKQYGKHPWLAVWALAMSFPVHAAVVGSAMFAGMAFHLPLHWAFYWVAVPVIVLVGAIPISPQGVGVQEFFAILLTRSQGVTVIQAFSLTMSIRVVQILWNLTGGIFVLRGNFHALATTEKKELQELEPEEDEPVLHETASDPAAVKAPVI